MISDTYRNNLNMLLSSPTTTQAQVTAARGRYIVALNRDIRNSNYLQDKSRLRNEYRNQMIAHQQQLNTRLRQTRRENNFVGVQIADEVNLKSRRLVNSARQFAQSENVSEYMVNGARVAGNTISTAFSVAKAPLMATVRLASLAAPVLTTIAVQPLHIPAYLFTKLINPDARYNGQIVTRMGREIGNVISGGLNVSNEVIRRI